MPPTVINSPVRVKYGAVSSLKQLVELKDVAFSCARTLKDDYHQATDLSVRARIATALAQVLRSWDCLEDRRRVLRNRGLPKTEEPASRFRRRIKSTVALLDRAPDAKELFLKPPVAISK